MKEQIKSMPLWKWLLELIVGIVVFIVIYGCAQSAMAIKPYWLKAIVCVTSGSAILGLFLSWTRLFEKTWRIDLLSDFRSFWTGLAIGALFFCAVAGAMAAVGVYRAGYSSPHWMLIVSLLCFNILVACGEEVIFRGILFRLIDDRFGFWWAIGISSLLFGFIHIMQPNATLWSSMAIAAEAGLLLGAAYKYSEALWLPIGIHCAWNFTQGNIFGFEVSGSEFEESIMNAVVTGPDVITGGTFGPEASIISVLLGLLLSIYFIRQIQLQRP